MKSCRRDRRERLIIGFAGETKWRANEAVLTALSAAMVKRFGGLQNLVNEWHAQIIKMAGTKHALDSYQSLVRLVAAAAKQQNQAK
jgi:hypothetical protein